MVGGAHLAQLLIETGAMVNVISGYHSTPLLAAVEGSRVESTKILIRHGAIMLGCIIHRAAELGSDAVVRLLIEFGADPLAEDGFGRKLMDHARLHD